MNYAGNLHNTLENLMMMSAAEDQDMVNEQIANKDNRILDHQYFVPGGKAHPLSTRDRVLVVGQEYRPPFYGHVFMFQLRDHLISPFTTGYIGVAGAADRHHEVLLAVQHVGHRRSGLRRRHVDGADFLARRLVVGAQHRAAAPVGAA